MTTAGLNGRVTRLERELAPPPAHQCRSCGLRHVRPLTIALLRGVLRLAGDSDLQRDPPVPLCLCTPCCGDPGDHWFAQRSHGMSTDEGTA